MAISSLQGHKMLSPKTKALLQCLNVIYFDDTLIDFMPSNSLWFFFALVLIEYTKKVTVILNAHEIY